MTATEYDAKTLAVGWLSVALASSADKELPALHNTISIDHYDEGIRLAATDRYMLLHTFIPNLDHKHDDAPPLDATPDRTVVVIDADGRGKNILGYLYGMAKAIEKAETLQPPPIISVDLDATDDDTGEPAFDGLERAKVALDYDGRERVSLDTYAGEYPRWRTLIDGFTSDITNNIGLNPTFLGRGKLGKLHDNKTVIWHFGGPDKAALLDVLDSQPVTEGLIMPVRWEIGADA